MTDHPRKDDKESFDVNLEFLEFFDPKGRSERVHKSDERATEQVFKVLATVHGGLGITLAAWLQRIFEQAGELSPLASSLAVALGFVGVGLLTLGLAALFAKRSTKAEKSAIESENQLVFYTRRGDKDHSKRLELVQKDWLKFGDLAHIRETRSMWLTATSWACLGLAFLMLFAGVFNSISSLKHGAVTVAPPMQTKPAASHPGGSLREQ